MEQGEWYYTLGGGETLGPVTIGDLRSMLTEGKLSYDDMVWHSSLAEWTALREIPQITGEPQADLPSAAAPVVPDGPCGLGGWLILPAIGLVLYFLRSAASLLASSLSIIAVFTENWLGTGMGELGVIILGRSFVVLLLVAFTIYVANLFAQKRRALPKAFIILLWANAAFVLGHRALMLAISTQIPREEMFRSVLSIGVAIAAAAIWTGYFRASIRVKNTFVVP